MKEIIDQLAANNLLQNIIEGVPIRIFWKDREGYYLGCNTMFARDAGFKNPDELIGKKDSDMGWREQAELYRADDTKVMDSGEAKLGFEEPQTTPDGGSIWLRTSKVPLRDAQQAVVGVLGIYEDITGRKQAEKSLADSEERLRLALNTSNQAWFDLHIPSGEGSVSPEYPGMLGYSNEEFDSSLQHWMASLHPDDRPTVLEMFEKGLKSSGPESIEYRRRTKSGEWIWIYTVARIIERDGDGNPLRMVGIQADVTARKQAEQRLAESEKTYRGIFNTLNEAVYILDEQWRFIDVNRGVELMCGFPREYFAGKTPAVLSAPGRNDMNDVVEKLGHAFNGEPQNFEFWASRSSGEVFPKEVHLYPGEYFGRRVVIAIATDISERKKAEGALLQSEQRLKQAQMIGEVGVWDWNPVSGALFWTEETYNIFGYAMGEVEPSFELFLSHVHPDDRKPLSKAVEAALHKGRKYNIDCRFVRTDGSEGVANAQGQVSYDETGNPVRMLGTFQNISSRKQAENRLREALSLQLATLEATADGILVVGIDGHWSAYNRKFADMWHLSDEILASGDDQRALSFVLDQLVDPQAFIDKVMELYAHPEVSSFDILSFKDGRVFERYSMEQRLSKSVVGRVWSFRDVTARCEAEEKLRSGEERFSLAMAGANDGLWDWNLETNTVYYSPRWFGMLGYEADAFPGIFDTWAELVHDEDRDRVMGEVDPMRGTVCPVI